MEKCVVCEHSEDMHVITRVTNFEFCAECSWNEIQKRNRPVALKWKHVFKLDNLQLIEDLAKERKLI